MQDDQAKLHAALTEMRTEAFDAAAAAADEAAAVEHKLKARVKVRTTYHPRTLLLTSGKTGLIPRMAHVSIA